MSKQIKKEYKKVFSSNPEKYYPVSVLKSLGFSRHKCRRCGKYFWSFEERDVCGDAVCTGSFDFLKRKISKVSFNYSDVWLNFAKLFESLGYKRIKRYPVVARWRDDTLYVKASIYDFQPHVTSGEIPPPAKKLVVPQPCLRFNDVDNVGITMSHMTGFVMIGQHAFLPKEEWSQEKLFEDITRWIFDVLGIPKQKVIFHEDAWAGGGNLGPCMEYFSGGLELGNQVYMLYKLNNNKPEELKLKVLDMGMGMERIAWFTQRTPTIYDATFPEVLKKLLKATGIKIDRELLNKYAPYGALVNTDEIENISYKNIAGSLKISEKELLNFLKTVSALYSLAEHSRTLLFAISDGSLPSNVGDAYNLRVLFRRAQQIIDENKWNVKIEDVCLWHADELKRLFPELSNDLEDLKNILKVEREKYYKTKQKTFEIISRIKASGKKLEEKDIIELYDSKGILPQQLIEAGLKIKIPEQFYKKVAERHIKKEKKKEEKKKYKLNVPLTEKLYYKDAPLKFKARVLKIIDNAVILDRTNFYPKSGGQDSDTGFINGIPVVKVEKQGDYVIHILKTVKGIKEGSEVDCSVDEKRRRQLTIHHTATHIVNGSARFVLGNHVYQAGAAKTVEKARLDITHYQPLTDEEIKKIEEKANEIVKKALPVKKFFIPRNLAEQKYGFRIYQGGYVPGKIIRIVEIKDFDVEACGGTHLDNTSQAGKIKIIKSSKIHDGIIRLEFKAGDIAMNERSYSDDEITAMKVFKVPYEKLNETFSRFVRESKQKLDYLNRLNLQLHREPEKLKIPEKSARDLFEVWKLLDKKIEHAEEMLVKVLRTELKDGAIKKVNLSPKAMLKLAEGFKRIILVNESNFFVFKGSDEEFRKFQQLGAKGGGKEIKQGVFNGDMELLQNILTK